MKIRRQGDRGSSAESSEKRRQLVEITERESQQVKEQITSPQVNFN